MSLTLPTASLLLTESLFDSEAQQKLKTEQERHRHARDELAKAKNALQFVKTQALVSTDPPVPVNYTVLTIGRATA